LLSEPCAQPDITLPLPLVEAGAAATPHISIIFLATAFQGYWHCFVKYWRGRERYDNKSKKLSFLFMYC